MLEEFKSDLEATMTVRCSHLSQNHKKLAVDILRKRMDTVWTPATRRVEEREKHDLSDSKNTRFSEEAPVAQ